MTCLVGSVLSGAGMKLHSSILGSFFVYTMALSMSIFKKKSLRRFSEKLPKLHYYNEKFGTFFQKFHKDFFFFENWHTVLGVKKSGLAKNLANNINPKSFIIIGQKLQIFYQ